jgi:ATP-dependent DNA helicase RecG
VNTGKPTAPPLSFDERSITTLKGVGGQVADKLHKLGLHTLQDLVFHLPFRYQDRTRITPIGALQLHCDVVVEGEVRAADFSFTGKAFGKRRSLVCRIQDGTGTLTLRFFHFSMAQKNQLKPGVRLRCYGETRRGSSGIELYHPEYQIISGKPATRPADTLSPGALSPEKLAPGKLSLEKLTLQQTLTPVYPITEGVTQVRVRNTIAQALAQLTEQSLKDLLPADPSVEIQESLANMLRWLHQPPANADLKSLLEGEHPFQQQLAFEELVAHHLSLLRLRQQLKKQSAVPLLNNAALEQQFLAALPFQLTNAQRKVIAEIRADLAKPEPMLRLLQGDVGSGKTLVAALAALQAVANGKQVAVMAPTEILAEQHLRNFERWFAPLNIQVTWLTGSLKTRVRNENLQMIASGAAPIVIGTHALFQDGVDYHDLALIIIDEQHRFGVQQRLALSSKGRTHQTGHSSQHPSSQRNEPHQLTMTATPIPRTLAMSVYADMDYSVIDELPPGRTPVNTALIDNNRREQVIERVRVVCKTGAQAYWVCTLIEEPEDQKTKEKLDCEAAETTATMLAQALPDVRIALVHGRLKSAEKVNIMDRFKRGDIQLLVATTVIEVGVDVPNASLMIIENPERLGLAQLHQLRGRVGRGGSLLKNQESFCVLLYNAPLSADGRERLGVMRETNDGFAIAEKDLQLRGPGEVLGTRQTGDIAFHMADLQRDAHMLTRVKQTAQQLLKEQPQVVAPLIKRWLGKNEQYGRV